MDFVTLLSLAFLAFGGVTYDVYRNPQSLEVEVLPTGNKLDPSVDRTFIALVVREQLERIARLHSMLAHPAIKSTDDKDLTETIAESVGGAALVSALSSAIAEPPSSLRFALYNEDKALTMYVMGRAHMQEFGEERFDAAIRQRPGESAVDLMKRSAIEGASHIDPYLTMLFLIQEGNHTGRSDRFDEALDIAQRFQARFPLARNILLARLNNLSGIVQLSRGDNVAAVAAFEGAVRKVPDGDVGPTFVASVENAAFGDIALGHFDDADVRIDTLLKVTGNMENLVGYESASAEGVVFHMDRAEVDRMLVSAYQLQGAIAMGQGRYKLAEARLAEALRIEPKRMTALWWLANLRDLEGDTNGGNQIRASILPIKPVATPYLENAAAWGTLYIGHNKVTELPSLYLPGALPATPPV